MQLATEDYPIPILNLNHQYVKLFILVPILLPLRLSQSHHFILRLLLVVLQAHIITTRTADEEGILSSAEDSRTNTSESKADMSGVTTTKTVMMGELAVSVSGRSVRSSEIVMK